MDETRDELLQRIAEQTKKQVFYARISAICGGILTMAVVIALLILVPSLLKTIHQVNENVPVEEIETLKRVYARVLRDYFAAPPRD